MRFEWVKATISAAVMGIAGFIWWYFYATRGALVSGVTAVVAVLAFIFTHLYVAKTENKTADDDLQRIRLYRMAFDRPAFQTSFANEVSLDAFDQAIEATVLTITGGILYDRANREIESIDRGGKSFLSRWTLEMDAVTSALQAIRDKYRAGKESGIFRFFEQNGSIFNPENDRRFSTEMDDLTVAAISKMNIVLAKAKLPLLPTYLKRDSSRPRS